MDICDAGTGDEYDSMYINYEWELKNIREQRGEKLH
jgi:hypothetical protein